METTSVKQVLQLFSQLSKSDQLELAEKISKKTFTERWRLMDTDLPDSEISEEEIMQEVRAVRYGNGKN